MKCTVHFKTASASDQRFRAMSALISTAVQLVLKNNGQKYEVRSGLVDNQYPPIEKPIWLAQINNDPLSY